MNRRHSFGQMPEYCWQAPTRSQIAKYVLFVHAFPATQLVKLGVFQERIERVDPRCDETGPAGTPIFMLVFMFIGTKPLGICASPL